MWDLFKKTVWKIFGDHIFDRAAGLAYTTLFSMAPTLIITIGLAGIIFGNEAAEGRVFIEIKNLIGEEGAITIQNIIRNAAFGPKDIWATILGGILFFLGATAIFTQLKGYLNEIWSVQSHPKNKDIITFLQNRLLSFAIVMACGFLLLVSLVISTILASFGNWLSVYLQIPVWFLSFLNGVISTAAITLFFVLLFKVLPDVYLYWKDVWVGALGTALLFGLGKYLIAAYLANSKITSVYGTAGSLVVILVWIYYSSLILLIGAVFTQVYAVKKERRIQPNPHAVFFKRKIVATVQPPKPKPPEAQELKT